MSSQALLAGVKLLGTSMEQLAKSPQNLMSLLGYHTTDVPYPTLAELLEAQSVVTPIFGLTLTLESAAPAEIG
jgi:hypothetical protein